ncbi:hypothetical protein TELCIR_15639 [Teladorsagia circumcincta]|uniref:PDZ domain-containing protein n=1 Tax=Teladorsagia circumcincta TaxID=45464 RepID=A0A2G9TXZ9_TELCI|nr:hypothetical protein TELCIR_15639 [Teladorsagia circumcincta]
MKSGSICGSQLKVLDHIVEVNGIPVTDKDVCREMLIKSMQAKHEDADPATDREKRATDAIVVKGRKDNRLIAVMHLMLLNLQPTQTQKEYQK